MILLLRSPQSYSLLPFDHSCCLPLTIYIDIYFNFSQILISVPTDIYILFFYLKVILFSGFRYIHLFVVFDGQAKTCFVNEMGLKLRQTMCWVVIIIRITIITVFIVVDESPSNSTVKVRFTIEGPKQLRHHFHFIDS